MERVDQSVSRFAPFFRCSFLLEKVDLTCLVKMAEREEALTGAATVRLALLVKVRLGLKRLLLLKRF